MSNSHQFEVRVSGWLADHWAGHFDGLDFQKTSDARGAHRPVDSHAGRPARIRVAPPLSSAVRRLEEPVSADERAIAAALLIDTAGVRGLAERFARARREGSSLLDVVREAAAQSWIPEWVPQNARPWLEARHEARRAFCRQVLDELRLEDRVVSG